MELRSPSALTLGAISLSSTGYRLADRVLAWVTEVAKSVLDAGYETTPATPLTSAIFLYISLTCFASGGDLRQSGLARLGKFREVFFYACTEAALAGLNVRALRLYVACTRASLATLLRRRYRCGKEHRSANYHEMFHHWLFSSTTGTSDPPEPA